jgi:Tfp pilus assembly protein PilF
VRKKYLDLCLAELQRLDGTQALTPRMETIYGTALEMAGRTDVAHARLDRQAQLHPEKQQEILLQHAGLYERAGDWQQAYEALRKYLAGSGGQVDLAASLQLANSLLHLNMGIQAMTVVESLRKEFADSDQLRSAMGAIWDFYGFKEEALFTLSQIKDMQNTLVMAHLLYDTGRFKEAAQIAKAAGITDMPEPQASKQAAFLPPAEWAVAWQGTQLAADDYAKEYERQAAALKGSTSPFIHDLTALKAGWFQTKGAAESSAISKWAAVGRDPMEQAVALNELTLLLARQGKRAAALESAVRAVSLCPGSAMMRRIEIALSNGDRKLVEAARQACPADSEIWLADLVTRSRVDSSGAWGLAAIKEATRQNAFSAGTIIRAGDLLLKAHMTNAACEAAQVAIANCRGFLPAYVLGLRCALMSGDKKWATACVLNASQTAVAPWPFYKILVSLKARDKAVDSDMIMALENLNQQFPGETRWAEELGDVYFAQGRMDNALAVLDTTIEKDGQNMNLRALLIAAESARLEGKPSRAMEILKTASAKYPDDVNVLNNLIYYLAQNPQTLPEARTLLPRALKLAGDNFAVLDTAAAVYSRCGEAEKAEEYMNRALKLAERGDYAWAELNYNAAEIEVAVGKLDEARRALNLVLNDERRTALVDAKARELQQRIDERIRQRK